MKLCIDCKHCHVATFFDGEVTQHFCANPVFPDPVIGTIEPKPCRLIRHNPELCGIRATGWEPKEVVLKE